MLDDLKSYKADAFTILTERQAEWAVFVIVLVLLLGGAW